SFDASSVVATQSFSAPASTLSISTRATAKAFSSRNGAIAASSPAASGPARPAFALSRIMIATRAASHFKVILSFMGDLQNWLPKSSLVELRTRIIEQFYEYGLILNNFGVPVGKAHVDAGVPRIERFIHDHPAVGVREILQRRRLHIDVPRLARRVSRIGHHVP